MDATWKKLSNQACRAAERGDAKRLRELQQVDPTLLTQGRPRAPLWLAASNGHVEVVKLLLRAKADPAREDWETTACAIPEAPLQVAARNGHDAVVAILEPLAQPLQLRQLMTYGSGSKPNRNLPASAGSSAMSKAFGWSPCTLRPTTANRRS